MSDKLVFGVPSKGRLMESTTKLLSSANIEIRKTGDERGYRGEIVDMPDAEVMFISASEIANALRIGRIHLGITGEDLVREEITDAERRVQFLQPLGFGHADVVVGVPDCWVDVRRMRDLDQAAQAYRRRHQRRMRVATKYLNITRRFFATYGISDYRIVESLGATEGTPAAGTADLIVDISSTGATLSANGLRVLDDGVILRSQANLLASKTVNWSPTTRAVQNEVLSRLGIV
ncbi:MAG: ATP phosphoribosyltransferase [Hyphomicrobiaceae bacterium]